MMVVNILDLRKRRWYTQQSIANKLDITRQTYSNIEKWISEISLWEAVKLSNILEIKLEELYDKDVVVESKKDIDWVKYVQIIKSCIKFWSYGDWKIPKTKLAKLCYLVDFWWFYNHLESITWLEYRRIQQGPVPDAYFAAVEWLEEEESISIEKKWKAYLIENISEPNTSVLNTEELAFIKKICKKWCDKDTKEIVDFTHKQMPWLMCREKEIIPYEFITQEEPNNVY
jgi:DNA-binding XRE family transcriptional regulator